MNEKIKKLREEANILEKIMERFPDIKEFTDRWGNEYLISELANPLCNDVWFNHNCGCCPDSPLQAWPFIEVEGRKIHSKPTSLYIGEKNKFGVGEIESENWEDRFIKNNINNVVIDKVKEYFKKNRARNLVLEDEEDE